MKIRYFVKIAFPYWENQVNNFEKLITDSDSSTPKILDRTVLNNPLLKIESTKLPALRYQLPGNVTVASVP